MSKYRQTTLAQQMYSTFLNLVLAFSLVLIANGFAPFIPNMPPMIRIPAFFNDWLGASVTILGTILVAATIYMPTNDRPPDVISIKYLAPVAMAICVGSSIWMLYLKTVIFDVVSGIAILGLTGSLLRMRTHSDNPSK